MGSLKWVVGFLGWVSGGPIGALIGFLLGSVVESGVDALRRLAADGMDPDGAAAGKSGMGGTYRTRTYSAAEQRNSFMISLLVLSSAVIRADGRVSSAELNVVREFIRRNFGDAAVEDATRILDGLNREQINIYKR